MINALNGLKQGTHNILAIPQGTEVTALCYRADFMNAIPCAWGIVLSNLGLVSSACVTLYFREKKSRKENYNYIHSDHVLHDLVFECECIDSTFTMIVVTNW